MRPPTTNAVAITATPWSERRHEDRQRQGRDDDERQVVGAADEGEAEPAPDRLDQPGHERERGRQRRGDADALEDASDDERPDGPAGLDAGQQQDGAAGEVGEPAAHERAQAADPIDEHARDEGGRDLDERRGPDDRRPIWGSGTPAWASATGSDAVNAWKPGLDREQGERRVGAPAHHPRTAAGEGGRRPRRSGPWRVGGSAGPAGRRRAIGP